MTWPAYRHIPTAEFRGHTLRESTGIQKPTTTYPPLEEDPRLFELYERAIPLFDDLKQYAFAPSEG